MKNSFIFYCLVIGSKLAKIEDNRTPPKPPFFLGGGLTQEIDNLSSVSNGRAENTQNDDKKKKILTRSTNYQYTRPG